MRPLLKLAALPLLPLALQACSTYTDADVAAAAPPPATLGQGPALWKVADEDTTIYLFGTVHALPKDVEWFNAPIATALGASDELVTEIPKVDPGDTAIQQATIAKGVATDGITLRNRLTPEQSARYEAALTGLGMPAAAFDSFEPWFAGMTLATLPLFRAGYDPNSGVEKVIEAEAEGKTRTALESVEYQLDLFDTLPEDVQVAFLMSGVDTIDELVPLLDRIVAEWAVGDVEDVARLAFTTARDDAVAEAVFFQRNRNWTDWIDARMDRPGTVFIAVGAGHLAGDKSVQAYLQQRGIAVTRVQ